MALPSRQPDPAAIARAQAQARRRALAYLHLFGAKDDERTEDQRLVLTDLREACSCARTRVRVDANGRVDPLAMMVDAGSRLGFEHIERRLAEALLPPEKTSE